MNTVHLNAMARRFTRSATGVRRADLDSILDEGVRFLQACREAGMPRAYISGCAVALHAQLLALMATIDKDLADVGEPAAPRLETCELEELF